jgi:hypothetical protein
MRRDAAQRISRPPRSTAPAAVRQRCGMGGQVTNGLRLPRLELDHPTPKERLDLSALVTINRAGRPSPRRERLANSCYRNCYRTR